MAMGKGFERGGSAGGPPIDGEKEVFVTEGGMPPAERPRGGREGDEQAEHLREDVGQAEGLQEGAGQAERLRDDAGLSPDQTQQEEDDKGLLDKAKDKLKDR